MKRMLAMMLALLCLFGAALAEEGEVHFLENVPEEMPLGAAENTEPVIPDGMERAVFDGDGRVTVTNVNQFPYSAICYIKVDSECGHSWTSSGFMISRDTVLTGAHCLYCDEHRQWAKRIVFYFGYKSDKNYLTKYDGGWDAWVATTFPDGYKSTNDIGYVKLRKNVGETTGWFGMRIGEDSRLDGYTFCVAGYRNGVLKYDYGRATLYGDNLLHYRADTEPGNSGCPVFDTDGYAVAVNVANNDNYNVGHRITNFVYEHMLEDGVF